MDSSKASAEDIYEFKSVKESDSSPDNKNSDPLDVGTEAVDPLSAPVSQEENSTKRAFSEISDSLDETTNEDDIKRKKRKDDSIKETKTITPQRAGGQAKGLANKQGTNAQNKSSLLNTSKAGNIHIFNYLI